MTQREINKFDDFVWKMVWDSAKHTIMASLQQFADHMNKKYPNEFWGVVDKNMIDRAFKRLEEMGRITTTTNGKYTYRTAMQQVSVFDYSDDAFFVDEKPKLAEQIAVDIYNYFLSNAIIGRSNSVSMGWLAKFFNVDERYLRRIVERINFRGYTFPDGSTFKYKIIGDIGRGGYYLAETVEEAFVHITTYEHKLFQASRKARILREDYGLHGQMSAVLKDVEDDLKSSYEQEYIRIQTKGKELLEKGAQYAFDNQRNG